MDPLVTVAIPTLSSSRLPYLREAVSSALSQTFPSIEILISQDHGPRGLDPVLQAWSQEMARRELKVRYRPSARKLGFAGNWNTVSKAALGKYIVIIGDDDRLLPSFVETLVKAIQPHAHVAFANHYLIDAQGRRLNEESVHLTRRYKRDTMPPGELEDPERWIWQNAIPITSALLRTDVLQRLRFKDDLNTPEMELYLRLAQAGGRFVFVSDYLAEYRTHALSATTDGLRTENLAAYLLQIPARADLEPYKRELLSQLMISAVSRCLLKGDHQRAREYLKNKYYPVNGAGTIRSLQNASAWLPKTWGCHLYQLMHKVRNCI